MCQMYRKKCACGQRTAEIFFGNMVLDEVSVKEVYCPDCSATADEDPVSTVKDNGWLLSLDTDVLRAYAPRMRLDADTLTAGRSSTRTSSPGSGSPPRTTSSGPRNGKNS